MTDRLQAERLVLQIERDLVAQTHLRTLLAHADATLAWRRRDLRNLKAQLKRDSMPQRPANGSSPRPGRTR